jgi:hypothetical protein
MRAIFVVAALGASLVAAAPDVVPIESAKGLKTFGVTVQPAEYRGRKALKVAEPTTNSGGGIAVVEGTTFKNGVIEAEIAGQPAAGAPGDARGFVGLAFRVQDGKRYEAFYLRPTNGRADDQLRRNHATQYIGEPDFPWHRLRKEHPGVYESYVDLETGAWTKVRIEVDGVKARLYVHGSPQPALVVNDLKLGDIAGGIGVWIGLGTEAYFSSLNVTAK